MNQLSISINSGNDDEYNLLLLPADTSLLSSEAQNKLESLSIHVAEIIINRIEGDDVTSRKVLNQICSWLADRFSEDPNMILYYACDDINPIPSRNNKSVNSQMPVQEYRSRLFSHLFDTYVRTHQIVGVYNFPIKIDGEGYSEYLHLIARERHKEVVNFIRTDVMEGFGK